ncbi:MAG: AbrB/MazE/SpoVT family DNA-binding domain-containing protein, partial [Candidatus Nanoarchaeia archaeon]
HINFNSNKMANRMKVQKTKNEQFIVTIPKAFAEALELKQSTVVEFKINEKGELVLKKKK